MNTQVHCGTSHGIVGLIQCIVISRLTYSESATNSPNRRHPSTDVKVVCRTHGLISVSILIVTPHWAYTDFEEDWIQRISTSLWMSDDCIWMDVIAPVQVQTIVEHIFLIIGSHHTVVTVYGSQWLQGQIVTISQAETYLCTETGSRQCLSQALVVGTLETKTQNCLNINPTILLVTSGIVAQVEQPVYMTLESLIVEFCFISFGKVITTTQTDAMVRRNITTDGQVHCLEEVQGATLFSIYIEDTGTHLQIGMIPDTIALPLIVVITIAWLPEMLQGIELLLVQEAIT